MNKTKILNFPNKKADPSIINSDQIDKLVTYLLTSIDNNIAGDVVEFGCYVGESSKYLMKTLIETGSNKKLYVYDSFDGLPNLSKWEENTGWKSGTLKTSEDVLVQNFQQNKLPVPIIHKDWFKNIPEYKIPDKICFAFLDGDFYDSIYDSLVKIYDRVSDGGYICFHDYERFDLPGVKAAIEDFFRERGIDYTVTKPCDQLGVFRKTTTKTIPQKKSLTLVTGLWDIKRDSLANGWNRSYKHYLDKFKELLNIDNNLIIFGDALLKDFVFTNRTENNTLFIERDLNWFKYNNYYTLIQHIRNNPYWYKQAGWLEESTQAKLEMYNPLVMSKMFLLNDAKILDTFDSSHLVWIDAGINNTVHHGYFTHDKVLDHITDKFNKFSFISFPYDGKIEIHGFEYNKMCEYSEAEVDRVCRGGFFGGPKDSISEINSIYYDLLMQTLSHGYMGTEESIFTIMSYKYPDLVQYFEIEKDGLIGKFFEDCKNNTLSPKTAKKLIQNNLDLSKTALYVIGFNSPKQLSTLIQSMIQYDKNFIDKPKKYLLNNSTDRTTDDEYKKICKTFDFEIIWPNENLGICGGRQYIAEHFDTTDSDFMFFFEDDMFFYPKEGEVCRNGFNRYADNLYEKSLKIIQTEGLDFLKLNFSEFFGDNSVQWSWYNVPQNIRAEFWPENNRLPRQGLDPNAPRTVFKNIKSFEGIPYASGEIYYCNWPQVVSKQGNKKMFLETKWAHPYEQTWMSYIYQETKKGNISGGLLLMTPTEHNRFEFYSAELRKES